MLDKRLEVSIILRTPIGCVEVTDAVNSGGLAAKPGGYFEQRYLFNEFTQWMVCSRLIEHEEVEVSA